jgi:hypothetical protein
VRSPDENIELTRAIPPNLHVRIIGAVPPSSHIEIIDCPYCGNAWWRYTFHHPGFIGAHVDQRDRDVCPGYLKRKQFHREHSCALCSPDKFTYNVAKCEDCDDHFHNADHSDCMARHQREVHNKEWSVRNA